VHDGKIVRTDVVSLPRGEPFEPSQEGAIFAQVVGFFAGDDNRVPSPRPNLVFESPIPEVIAMHPGHSRVTNFPDIHFRAGEERPTRLVLDLLQHSV